MSNESSPVLRIGLTGGIASGKSAVADMFAALGAIIIDTDIIAREVVRRGAPALAEIIAAFGPQVIDKEGNLDRAVMRREVFSDDQKRERLESILHPRIRDRTLALAAESGGPYQIVVVPLLVESGFDRFVNRILVVDCPEGLQRKRLMSRDQESAAQVERILRAQADRTARLAVADDVIDNGGTLEDTRSQVTVLHEKYLALAN